MGALEVCMRYHVRLWSALHFNGQGVKRAQHVKCTASPGREGHIQSVCWVLRGVGCHGVAPHCAVPCSAMVCRAVRWCSF